MFGMSVSEILIIMVIAVIFIGPKKLPELGRQLGKFFRSYRGIKDDIQGQIRKVQEDESLNPNLFPDKLEEKKEHGSEQQ